MIDRKPNLCGVNTPCTGMTPSLQRECRFFLKQRDAQDCGHIDWRNRCVCEEAIYDAARQICLGLSHLAPPHQGGDK